jgi:alpha-1,2-mannosyltransferase
VIWAAALVLGAALAIALRWGPELPGSLFGDLTIYRHAATRISHGQAVYVSSGMPFTYPPFAAVLFLPTVWLGAVATEVLFTTASVVGGLLATAVVARRAGLSPLAVTAVTILALALEPVVRTVRLGQINLLLFALVVLDVLVLPPRWRGSLTGLAAGIKLTPAVFVLHFLFRRDGRAVLRVGLGFLATVLVGAVVVPGDSWRYWTELFYDPGHIGGYAYVDNQSVFAAMVRLLRTEHPPGALYLVLGAAAMALGVAATRRQLRQGQELAALTCIGMTGLLLSPVSWSHHWTWLIPTIVVLLARRAWSGVTVVTAVTYLAPMWWTPYGGLREFRHQWWQAGLCLTFTAVALGFLIYMLTQRTASASSAGASDHEEAPAPQGALVGPRR